MRTRDVAAVVARLGYWLGPWSSDRVPRGIRRSVHPAGDTRAYVYEPIGQAAGTYLVLPGLHFLGPDDPRLDRFCRILAASELLVVAPHIRSFSRLILDRSAFDDGRAALELARERAARAGTREPAAFSISFGSLLALDLATSERPPQAAVLFGGYAEFASTVRFAVTGRALFQGESLAIERDPLNSPVVFLNLLDQLEVAGDKTLLAQAWKQMVHRTWGKLELKRPGARDAHAHTIASQLPAGLREPFLRGCCLADGAVEWLERGLERAPHGRAYLDPRARLGSVACPTVLVHGRGDDVIPYFESLKLAAALPRAMLRGMHLTGMYGHTGAAAVGPAAAAREAATMARMLFALGRGPLG